jgi:hypothetical protein
MSKNTQEYINGLLNKHKVFYLDLSTPCLVSECSHCSKKSWNETVPNLTGEIENLSEFQNLTGINASNNKFTSLNGIFTLPNKKSLRSLNFFGNKIKEVDLVHLFTEFPNLQKLNLDYNPVSIKNLENLTSEQFSRLVNGIKSKNLKFSPRQGTVYADLLDYTQKLVKSGNSSQQQQAQQLQTIIQENSPVKNEQGPNKTNYTPFIIGGVLVVGLAIMVSYLVGRKKKEKEF